MKLRFLVSLVLGCGLTLSIARAADWPQWRGPNRDGISGETGLLKEWPKSGPPLVWQAKEIGSGYSTPAVIGNRLYLLSNEGNSDEYVQALDAADGKQIWKRSIGKVGKPDQKPDYPAARSTPTVDGELLYALGSDGDLACLKTATGEVVWKRSLPDDFGGKSGIWAYSESPLVDGEKLVVTPGGKDATLAALDKKTGDVIWKSAVPGGDQAGYASVIAVDVGGIKQYVQFLQKGLVGVAAKDGKFLWRYDKTSQNSPANIPTPVFHEGLVYSGTARGGGGSVKLTAKSDGIEAAPAYFNLKLPNSIGGSVYVDGYLYGTSSQGLMCAEFASGDVKWQERGIGAASILYADARLYLHGENGEVALVEATPEAYREKGRFTPSDQPDRGKSKAWAYPVVANGRLYIRDASSLWCYDIKTKP